MSIIADKSEEFALNIVKLYKYLLDEQKEYIMSKQLLRSGTSIGANIAEATYAQSKADFISKMSIALKEASETQYWLKLLTKSEYIIDKQIMSDCIELIKILTSIVSNSKTK